MKSSIYFIALLLVISLSACGKPAPESASADNYGTTLDGKAAEGRNEVK